MAIGAATVVGSGLAEPERLSARFAAIDMARSTSLNKSDNDPAPAKRVCRTQTNKVYKPAPSKPCILAII